MTRWVVALRQVIGPGAQCRDGLHVLEHGLQHGNTRFERPDILPCLDGRALPDSLWQRGLGGHGSRMVQEIESGKHAFLACPT